MKRCLKCDATFAGDDWICPVCHFAPANVQGCLAFAPELAGGGEGYQDSYFNELARLEAANFWFRARNQLIFWALQKHFKDAQNFLEIGCGTGFVLSGIAQAFPQMLLNGSEVSANGLAHAAQRIPQANFFQMDARAIPFEAEFDTIGAFDVIEHINQDEAVLAQIFRALKPGGGMLLTVPQHEFLWSQVDEHACHVRRYHAPELRTRIERAGFKVLTMTSFVSLLLPLMFVSRLARRKARQDFDVLAELRLNPVTNFALKSVLDFERGLIRAGVRLPFGGSLLVAAQKH